MFECLACNLLQTSPLKLCYEKLRFFYMCSQNAGNAISETQILKISCGGTCPQLQSPQLNRACGILLTPSAIAYYAGVGRGKWALWQFCPTTEESLKNALRFSALGNLKQLLKRLFYA
jgi:hypothetical protein